MLGPLSYICQLHTIVWQCWLLSLLVADFLFFFFFLLYFTVSEVRIMYFKHIPSFPYHLLLSELSSLPTPICDYFLFVFFFHPLQIVFPSLSWEWGLSWCIVTLPGITGVSHIIKENWLCLYQKLLSDNWSPVSGGISCPPALPLYSRILSDWSLHSSYACCHIIVNLHIHLPYCVWKTLFSGCYQPPVAFHAILWRDSPSPGRRRVI